MDIIVCILQWNCRLIFQLFNMFKYLQILASSLIIWPPLHITLVTFLDDYFFIDCTSTNSNNDNAVPAVHLFTRHPVSLHFTHKIYIETVEDT